MKAIADAAREEHMTYPCFLDKGSAWQKSLGTNGEIPYFVVISKDGRIAAKHKGKIGQGSPAETEIASVIERSLAARP